VVRAMNREIKVTALTEVNTHILEVARESRSAESEWEFFCECGRANCHEYVRLTVAAFVSLRDDDLAVLKPGHRLSQEVRVRMLRDGAWAFRAPGAAPRKAGSWRSAIASHWTSLDP
jgi:hypothetical protein